MAGTLTTHVLDTSMPASRWNGHRLFRIDPESEERAVTPRAQMPRPPMVPSSPETRWHRISSISSAWATISRRGREGERADPVSGQGTLPFRCRGPGRQLPYPALGLSLGLFHLPWELARRFSRGR